MFDRLGLTGARAVAAARREQRNILLILLIFAASLPHLQAQTSVEGIVRGVILDPAGAAVAGAVIRIEDARRGLAFNTACDIQGDFIFSHVPAGAYVATVQAPSFTTLVLDRVLVQVGGITELDPRLRVAGVQTSVTVIDSLEESAGVSLEQSSGTAVASVIGTYEMDGLPVNGRRWQSFALLTPTANADDQGGDLLSFRGLAVTQNNTTVDGISNDQSFQAVPRGMGIINDREADDQTGAEPGGARRNAASWRRAGATYIFSQEAVREFRVTLRTIRLSMGTGLVGQLRQSRRAELTTCTAQASIPRDQAHGAQQIRSLSRRTIRMA
jgi:hypothetical protein